MKPSQYFKQFRSYPRLILFFLLVVVSVGILFTPLAAQSPNTPTDAETRIILLHYNDCHAKIDRLPRIARYVAEERKKYDNVFFLNAGDNFSGNPVVDMAEPKGEPVRLLMNKIGLDVLTLGNHEFDYGQEILARFIREANYPILCANVRVNTPPLPQPLPFTYLKTRNGIQIAVLGLVEVSRDTGLPASHPQKLQGLTFLDPLETAKKYLYLREKSPVFVLLSHLGLEDDIPLAEKLGTFDVIVGGHSHTTITEPKETNGVLIAQAGAQGQFIGRIELVVKNGRVIEKKGSLIEVKSLPPGEPELEKMVTEFSNNPVMDTVVTTLSRPLQGNHELGYLITDSICAMNHLDIAFHNSGGIRIPALNQKVVVKDIYSLNPFGNRIVRIQMTPEEIRSLLRFDFERHKSLDIKISGFTYTLTHTPDFKVKDIVLSDPQGQPLDEKRTYAVGMNDYMILTYKFAHQDPGKTLEETVAQTLMDYLKTSRDVCVGLDGLRAISQMVAVDTTATLGKTEVDISAGTVLNAGSSSAGNLAADAMAASSGAQIALYPQRLLYYGPMVPASAPLFRENILYFYPFAIQNKIVTATLTGQVLVDFILKRSKQAHGIDLQVSGLTYTIHLDADQQVSAVTCHINGKPLEPAQTYRVAFNEYEWNKSYQLQALCTDAVTSTQTMEEILLAYVRAKGTIDAQIQAPRVILQPVQPTRPATPKK